MDDLRATRDGVATASPAFPITNAIERLVAAVNAALSGYDEIERGLNAAARMGGTKFHVGDMQVAIASIKAKTNEAVKTAWTMETVDASVERFQTTAELAADAKFFAHSAEAHGTAWGRGCASILRHCADALTGNGNQQPSISAVDPVADRGQTGSTRAESSSSSDLSLTQQRDSLQQQVARLVAVANASLSGYDEIESVLKSAARMGGTRFEISDMLVAVASIKAKTNEAIKSEWTAAPQAEAQRDALKAFIDEHDYAEEFHEWQNR